jgi:hypothetical protein
VAIFGLSYALSAAAIDALGASSGTVCNADGACVGTGDPLARDLLVPVVGPWLAMGSANDVREIPILAFLGIAQATGAALTIAGIMRYSADGAAAEAPREAAGARRAQPRPRGIVSFCVLPTRDGAFGFLSGRL